jgi:hypothetical protein
LITDLIGVNALSETKSGMFFRLFATDSQNRKPCAPGTNDPARSLKLLWRLAEFTDESSLQRQIAETLE